MIDESLVYLQIRGKTCEEDLGIWIKTITPAIFA